LQRFSAWEFDSENAVQTEASAVRGRRKLAVAVG
jgi:hypothetical protein